MTGDINISGRNKHNFINGDFIVILAVIFGFLLSGGVYFKTSKVTDNANYETRVITPAYNGTDKDGLQLQTFDILKCKDKTAIDFLIDNSGSMQFGNKMKELKKALNTFATNFPLSGVIALQTYSVTVADRVPFSIFQEVKPQFISEVNDMWPQTATHSKTAFQVAQDKINNARTKFPDHKYSLIFISDGIPETAAGNIACPGKIGSEYCMEHPITKGECRCYDVDQDPRTVAAELKASNVRIFTIAFTDTLADAYLNSKLQSLMLDLASAPEDYFHAPIESQLTGIIEQITEEVCF